MLMGQEKLAIQTLQRLGAENVSLRSDVAVCKERWTDKLEPDQIAIIDMILQAIRSKLRIPSLLLVIFSLLAATGCNATHAVAGDTIVVESTDEFWFDVGGKYHGVSDGDIQLLRAGATCIAPENIDVSGTSLALEYSKVSAGIRERAYGLKMTTRCSLRLSENVTLGEKRIELYMPGLWTVTRSFSAIPMQGDSRFAAEDGNVYIGNVTVHESGVAKVTAQLGHWFLVAAGLAVALLVLFVLGMSKSRAR